MSSSRTFDCAVADAMREAALKAILPLFHPGKPIDASFKAIGEAVTVADRDSEAILFERLSSLTPGVAVIGEEAVHDKPALSEQIVNGTSWVVDPLDGTGNFALGQSPFGMLVALVEDGFPISGWILDPLSDRFCSAHIGQGAYIDGERFQAPSARSRRPTVAVTRLFADDTYRAALIATLNRTCDVVDSPRCAADQYPRVAFGQNDATLFTRTIAWDHAAGVVFLNEAGGQALRQNGLPYHCGEPDAGLIIATSPRIWNDISGVLLESSVILANSNKADNVALP